VKNEVLRWLLNEPFEIPACGNTCVTHYNSLLCMCPAEAQFQAINLLRPWEKGGECSVPNGTEINPTRTRVARFSQDNRLSEISSRRNYTFRNSSLFEQK
jgi:hypothetical protein